MISRVRLQSRILDLEERMAMLETKQQILLEAIIKLKEEGKK